MKSLRISWRGRLMALLLLLVGLYVALWDREDNLASAGVPLNVPFAGKVEQRVLDDTANGNTTPIMLVLAQQADVSRADTMKDQDARGWYVYTTLRNFAEKTQAPIRKMLDSQGVEYHPFWAANAIALTADRALVDSLAARSDVGRIESDRPFNGITDPVRAKDAVVSDAPETIEWGVQRVNAPQVWAMGYTGQGIVVANQDTGMRWTHNAIKPHYRGWDGTTADHNYNWHDSIHTSSGNPCGNNSQQPCDDDGHGTHTTGTTTGDDGVTNQVGVAPGAKWIGCRNMDQGVGTPSTYTECFQFFIAPTDLNGNNPDPTLRPHVMNNSWTCPTSEGCAATTLQAIVENTQAAGIFVEASAGNSGSGCSSVTDPPAIYDASFSTGALDSSNTLAGFSSRGPSVFYNLLKPNISAPGVGVRSSLSGSDSSYGSLSGTSMAGPHVVGVVALLWSARPDLARDIATTKNVLQNTANPQVIVSPAQTCNGIPNTVIPNNSFGYGRVDALAAVNSVPLGTPTDTPTPCPACTSTPTRTITPTRTATPCVANYAYTTGTATIVPGTTLVAGSQCDDCVNPVALPFAFTFYGTAYSSVNPSSNGNVQFASADSSWSNACLPYASFDSVVMPYWDDLNLSTTGSCTGGCGIYTSVTGVAPNRIFNIEWRAVRYSTTTQVNFEVRLYETTSQIDFVYGTMGDAGTSATAGLQRSTGTQFVQYSCNTSGLNTGLLITWSVQMCGTPTNTPTPTDTSIPTFTYTPTVTSTSTPTSQPRLQGHVLLQGRGNPPSARWSEPITLTLRPTGGGAAVNYPAITDLSGYFTVTLTTGAGSYDWRVKNVHALATAGSAAIGGGLTTVEMGTLLEGDANADNCVNAPDLNVLRLAFGSSVGDPNYNANADFNADATVNTSDFNLLRTNFGMCGAPPLP